MAAPLAMVGPTGLAPSGLRRLLGSSRAPLWARRRSPEPLLLALLLLASGTTFVRLPVSTGTLGSSAACQHPLGLLLVRRAEPELGAAVPLPTECVAEGDMVTVAYTGWLGDTSEVFDSSAGRKPLQFVAGGSSVIVGLSKGVVGLPLNQRSELVLEPSEAYGDWDKAKLVRTPAANMPPGAKAGTQIMVGTGKPGEGGTRAIVREVLEGDEAADGQAVAVLDLNHPLAGQTLRFEVEVLAREIPREVQAGDQVAIQYAVRLAEDETGAVIDASPPGKPISFVAGGGQNQTILPGLAKAAVGLRVGVREEVRVEAADGFGDWKEENVVEVARDRLPEEGVTVGAQISVQGGEGQELQAIVQSIKEDTVSIDLNSPLAGKALIFTVEVVKLKPAASG